MPGEWIDELGALLMHFPDNPQVAMDLYRSPMSDRETRELARAMMSSSMEPYPNEFQPQPLQEMSQGGAVEPEEGSFDGLL